jgi:hypothetical protein
MIGVTVVVAFVDAEGESLLRCNDNIRDQVQHADRSARPVIRWTASIALLTLLRRTTMARRVNDAGVDEGIDDRPLAVSIYSPLCT